MTSEDDTDPVLHGYLGPETGGPAYVPPPVAVDSCPPNRRRAPRLTAKKLTSYVFTGFYIWYLDEMTGRRLQTLIRREVARVRWQLVAHPLEIAPRDITALHTEARRITEEAARDHSP